MRIRQILFSPLRKSLKAASALSLALLVSVTVSCKKDDPDTPKPEPDPDPIEDVKPDFSLKTLDKMTLREKVGQLFFIRPESLCTTGSLSYKTLTSNMEETYKEYPCGGVILYAQNIDFPLQTTMLTDDFHRLANYPLLCIDEEGGLVARIAKNKNFQVPTYTSMGAIGDTKDPKNAFNAGSQIGTYLFKYGLDVNFAPVADVNSNPDNPVIGTRSFSSDPDIAAEMSSQFLLGMKEKHIEGCLKHFPGHGDTKTDSHYGYAETLKTWEEMKECEMIPFQKGIEAGAQLIMTAHIATPNVTGDSKPATMSKHFLQTVLREQLGYKGIIVTDGMEMGAITKEYEPGEAAIGVILAGADIILGPEDYFEAFDSVVNAVEHGVISEKRIDESVERILKLKKQMMDSRKAAN